MVRLIARRVASGLVTLALVTMLVFALIHLAPGGPLWGLLGGDDAIQRVSPETRAELARLYHLDRPLAEQYVRWLGDLLHGDLGRSFHDRRPVSEKIGERLGITVLLNGLALGLAMLFAIPLGAAAALRPGSRLDRWTGAGTYVLYALPVFWGGLLLQLTLSVQLEWLPLAGLVHDDHFRMGLLAQLADRASHLVLPVLCLGYGGLAFLSRFVRATLIDNAAPESYLAARARGLTGLAVLYRHGFRLAALPMLTLAGFLLPTLVSGSVIVESIFSIPGLGRLFLDAAFQRDVPVLMALTLVSGILTLVGIVAADIAYGLFDPRVRRG